MSSRTIASSAPWRRRRRRGDVRRQRDLRRLPPGRSEPVARLAAQAAPCSTRPTNRCSAISTTRASTITACARASSARTASSWSRPTAPTASSPPSRSSTPSASIRCSNIWSNFPTAGCRRCRSPGTAGRRTQGGQRWFHLYPNEEIKHDDVLHWTKLNQNWNFMCAECHSTGVRKNYDAANDRFATTWAEISVGCEACHGQGSRHVAWAREQQSWWPFGKSDDPTQGPARPLRRAARRHLADRSADRQCRAQLHAGDAAQGGRDLRPVPRAPRRILRGLGSRPIAVRHACGLAARPRALSRRRADAATRSTTTARSSRARCSRPASPAAIATSRTAPSCARPATASACNVMRPTSTRPPRITVTRASNPPLACASCHMPARTYMVVDRRHDHSFRVPRPDLSAKLGTPNACNDCHTDKTGGMGGGGGRALARARPKGLPDLCRGVPRRVDRPGDAAALLGAVAARSQRAGRSRAPAR